MPLPPDAFDRNALLLQMSERISRTFDLPEILQLLLESVRQVVPFDAAGVFVLNAFVNLPGRRVGRVIGAMTAIGFDLDPNREDPMLGAGKGIIGQVIRTGLPIVAPDVRENPHYVSGRQSTLSEVAVPIAIGGRVIGALNLESDRLGAYSDAEARDLGFFATAAAISIDRAVLHHQVLEKQHLDHHMALAREVQESLLPQHAPAVPGYDLAGVNLPTMDIGGDYFDYVPLGDGRLGLAVADVSGKGVAAALIMATFRAALRIELRRNGTLGRVMDEVDHLLRDSIGPSRFVTAVCGILQPPTGEFAYVNCGHNPPMVLHRTGGCTLLDRGRPALGMPVPESQETGCVRLEPGEMLAIYTDGVVELAADDGAEFGPARLESTLRRNSARAAKEVVQAVVHDTLAYSGRSSYDDDFTLLVVKRDA